MTDLPATSSELQGRVALVTGAALRTGRALALALARAGADVLIHYRSSHAEAESLAAANKRIGNILKKSDGEASGTLDQGLLQDDQEKALHQELDKVTKAAEPKFDAGDYEAALADCAALKAPVDAFFDKVMVNAEDPALRNNRYALLRELHGLMNRIADLSKLAK